jgi:4-amino-4-deoxy-L-arabinose transferase-like glycosyltransferase
MHDTSTEDHPRRRIRFASLSRWDRIAVLSLMIGAVLRVTWLFVHPALDFVYSDMEGYVQRAQRLVSGPPPGRFDAFYPPGAHVLVAMPLEIFGTGRTGLWAAAVLWCALSIAIPFLAWVLARQLLTPAAAAITAGLCAVWPLYITYGAYFTSETPALAFMLAALCLATAASRSAGRNALSLSMLAGLMGGIAAATRPQWLLNLAIVAVILIVTFRKRIAPLAGFTVGIMLVLLLAVGVNSSAAHRLTGLSENSGLNFWLGHCDVYDVTTVDDKQGISANFTNPVPLQLHRGQSYHFVDRAIWDQAFFYHLGWDCIEHDGARHFFVISRNIMDMTATTTPWPQMHNARGERDVVHVANVIYCLLLPWILIESLFLIRRKRVGGQPSGEMIMFAHLACVIPLAILFIGEPRIRSVYDVFGFALVAALLAERFHLDESPSGDTPSQTLDASKKE